MSEHFIKNIEIKNFKCFEDFKAEGFGRVNLIGGKNNVGKTAFMEACFLGMNMPEGYFEIGFEDIAFDMKSELNKVKNTFSILEFHRDTSDFLLSNTDIEFKFRKSEFIINNISKSYDKKIILKEIDKKQILFNITFISTIDILNEQLIYFIDEIKLLDKEDELNIILKNLFNIDKIDVIHDKVMIKENRKYTLLREFGDGIKHFISIIFTLYLNKDSILYLDEIENGIHYTLFEKLWEIILTISKQQNVQVFATTHSKECIESYARVAKKLEDEEIGFIELGRNKKNELDSVVMDSEMFQRFIKLGNEVRGW